MDRAGRSRVDLGLGDAQPMTLGEGFQEAHQGIGGHLIEQHPDAGAALGLAALELIEHALFAGHAFDGGQRALRTVGRAFRHGTALSGLDLRNPLTDLGVLGGEIGMGLACAIARLGQGLPDQRPGQQWQGKRRADQQDAPILRAEPGPPGLQVLHALGHPFAPFKRRRACASAPSTRCSASSACIPDSCFRVLRRLSRVAPSAAPSWASSVWP